MLTLEDVFLRKDGTERIGGHLVVARKADVIIALPKALAAEAEENVNIALGEDVTRH